MPITSIQPFDITRSMTRSMTDGRRGSVLFVVSTIRDAEGFSIFSVEGGFTGKTSININGIACTSENVVDDFNMTAVAPTDDLLHSTIYAMQIF
jgi:hypothetical protein